MKLKKLNTVAIGASILGAIVYFNCWRTPAPAPGSTPAPENALGMRTTSATMAPFTGLIPGYTGLAGWESGAATIPGPGAGAGAVTGVDELMAAPADAVSIAWRGYQGAIPGSVSLKKWARGDMVYYEMSGPINRRYTGQREDVTNWGNYPAYEAFFSKGGTKYDQWIVSISGAMVYHYDGWYLFKSQEALPAARYRVKVEGDHVTVLFCCDAKSPPANLVFNYNGGDGTAWGKDGLSWVTTGDAERGWDHHRAEWWRNP